MQRWPVLFSVHKRAREWKRTVESWETKNEEREVRTLVLFRSDRWIVVGGGPSPLHPLSEWNDVRSDEAVADGAFELKTNAPPSAHCEESSNAVRQDLVSVLNS